MSRQDGDPTMVSSSIALLQERFRKLQKVRERREEKELLKLSAEPQRVSSLTRHVDPTNLSFQSEVIHQLPHRQKASQDHQSLSLGLDLQTKQADDHIHDMRTQTFTSPWSTINTAASSSTRNFENSDIDTSLHL